MCLFICYYIENDNPMPGGGFPSYTVCNLVGRIQYGECLERHFDYFISVFLTQD